MVPFREIETIVNKPSEIPDIRWPLYSTTGELRRYDLRNGRILASELSGPTGELIYSNTGQPQVFPLGELGFDNTVADDLKPICITSDLTWIEIAVTGMGDGTGPGFDIEIELFESCPSVGGTPIAGTYYNTVLPDDGDFLVVLDLSDHPVSIHGTVWLQVHSTSPNAGWLFGGMPDVGTSDDRVDLIPFSCSTYFGGCPPKGSACANGYVVMYGINCVAQHLAYRADILSAFFTPLNLDERIADDIVPIRAPGDLCSLTAWIVRTAGLDGPYVMHVEIWSNDEILDRPNAPVLGAMRDHPGIGNGFRDESELIFEPPVEIPSSKFWVVYDVDGNEAGPTLVGAAPQIGSSGDCYAKFGDPTLGEWSGCEWNFGGCPFAPCGTFENLIWCGGPEAWGACCDDGPSGEDTCFEHVPQSLCHGRFVEATACDPDPFDPPCGTAACCRPDNVCVSLSPMECEEANGYWDIGHLCGDDGYSCPRIECTTATNSCDDTNPMHGGCNDVACCEIVCEIEEACCTEAWDSSCVSLYHRHCPPDSCEGAVMVTCNDSVILDNTLATDSLSDPGFSCHNSSIPESFGSVWAKFIPTESTAMIRTCNSPSPADDSVISLYSGACGDLIEIACSDDVIGCHPVTNFNSVICANDLVPGATYYVQLASRTNADRGPYNLEVQCPAPANCGPPMRPANDDCADAIPIDEGVHPFTSVNSTTDGPLLPAPTCNEGFDHDLAYDVWFRYTAPGHGFATIDLCSETDFDSGIAVYEGCQCPAQTANTIACNDDGCPPEEPEVGGASRVTFEATHGQCYKIRVGGYGPFATGSGEIAISFVFIDGGCPDGGVTFINPLNGTVDARQPHSPSNLVPLQGISSFGVHAPAGADASCWRMCETSSFGSPNSISSVADNGNGSYTIHLARPLTPGAATRISYTPMSGPSTTGTFYAHPANVNGDNIANPLDILRIIDCLNGIQPNVNCPHGIYSRDIDQSGVFNPADILRVIDLLNGADLFDVWNGTTLPTNTCIP